MAYQRRGLNLAFISFSILILFSCESKDEPVYVGSWESSGQVIASDIVYNTTRTLILTRSTYEETYLIQRENQGIIAGILGTKGKLAFSRYYMVFRLEELGTCIRDEMDSCTEAVQWFGEGTQYWTENSPYFESTVKGEYKVDGTTLYLKRDLNNDNDTDDTGEDIEFERI
jgi:hypothetical protein